MVEDNKSEASATGFSPHIEELHEFFRSRGVAFGKPDDLAPFVERLSKDESFRDEMASMVRAIIYRERDGLTPIELMELLMRAVAGISAEDVPEQVRDAARQMMGFAAGVFRSRWNPGGAVAAEDKVDGSTNDVTEAALAAKAEDAAAETITRPMTPIFYQAQVVANGGQEPEIAPETVPTIVKEPAVVDKQETGKTPEKEREVVLPLRGKSEAADGPTLNLAGYAASEPVVTFLRGDGKSEVLASDRSQGWSAVAVALAVLIAFGAGMFARQWMLTRYGPAWPWHVPVALMGIHKSEPAVAAKPVAAQPAAPVGVGTPSAAPSGTTAAPRKPAQVEAARSEWRGGRESGSDLGPPAGNASAGNAAMGGAARPTPGSGGAELAEGVADPNASGIKPSPQVREKALRSARVTAMVGASPALMASHLVFAPQPEYPNLAKIAHIQGPVVVQALVGRDGSVVRAQAISGHRLLRAAAEEAVYGRRYRPYVVNGIPMAVRTLVTVDFPPR